MKILKNILIALLVLVGIVLIIAAILPKTFHAGNELVVNKNAHEVFEYVKQIKKQGEYDNWSRQDPDIEKQYTGEDGTVGFTYTWKSKKVGNGKQVITKIEDGKRVEMDLFFDNAEEANKSFIAVDSIAPSQTKVTWEIDGKMPFPFNIFTLFYDMNEDFKQGLLNLKNNLEK
ncbi:SRPBCC family protein [Sphingobacterium bovistauri]|uniref:SRPBCC family protein n=1 Tax=Sphingobacterium bovistauri TaxID=2781959 RepID=A0ABS7Z6A7_9SPHI|nr:SRPBCC family protein [Sphingobacterium bovistauri]MCA5005117.1 SRPBCC family protein [Sphingobacterium bovistauri]